MADLNPEVFEDLKVAERSRPLFEAAGLPLSTWEAYALAFNERNLLRREIDRIVEKRGAPAIHAEVLGRLKALRTELDPMVGGLRKFLPESTGAPEERERQEMVLGFITVSPTAREVAAKWISDPDRYRTEASQKLHLIENVVEKYRRALRAETDARLAPVAPAPTNGASVPQPGAVTRILKKTGPPPAAPASLEAAAANGEISLIWSSVAGAVLYAVKRATRAGGPYSTIARPAQDCYADTDLQNGATYFYVVASLDDAGAEGPASAEVSATPLAPPLAPASLTASGGHHRVSLAWSPSAGAASYKLVRAMTPAGPFQTVVSTPDTSFTDTGVTNGTTYFYAVAAMNGAGESPVSAQAQAMPVAPPPAPVGLSATPGSGRVTLAWTAVHGASSYTVRRATDPAGPFETLAGPAGESYADSGVDNGTTYYYAVTALNPGGESVPSAPVSAVPIGAPAAPADLKAMAGNGEIMLSWKAVPNASSYVVERAIAAPGPWSAIAHPAGPSYTDTGLANGSTLYYRVSALNAGGRSAPGDPIPAAPVSPPFAPAGLTATAGNTRVTLTWTASPGATVYVLRRSTAPGGPHETIAHPPGTAHADLLLTNNTAYFYTLAARNGGGESAPSGEVTATPVGPPGAPADLEALPGNGRISLRWRSVPNADRYRVMRSTTPSGPYSAIANPSETGFVDDGVANGTVYFYVVRAMNEGGKGPYSSEVKAAPLAPPPAPEGLAATPGNGSVSLSWSPVPDATGYALLRAASPDGPFSAIATPASTSALDNGVTNGTAYFYAVTAHNAGGEGPRSGAVTVIPLAPPQAPSGLTALPGNGRVALAWSMSPRAAVYSVRRSTLPTGPFETVGATPTTEFADLTVTNGTLYHYAVVAQNAAGEGAPSAPVAATPVAPPSAPTGLQISAGDGRVSISWSPAPRATSYSVRRSTKSGGPYASIAFPSAPSHLDADLPNGSSYFYVITALNAGGESPESAEAGAAPVAAPAAVTTLEAASGNGQVSLRWPAAENASSYVVKRSIEAEGTYAPVATVAACAYVDTGLTNGTTYHYRVNAVNAGGGGIDSATATATPIAPPPAPTALTATPGHREVSLTWASSPRAAGYHVKRSESPGGPYAEVATAIGPSHQDTGLSNGTSYCYIVIAVNAGGESPPSDEATAMPVDPPGVPADVTATAGNNQVLVVWTAVPGATYYQIKRAANRRGPFVTTANVSRATFIDNGVENGKSYYYVVHAVNPGGRSAHSVRVSATPVPPPPAPTGVIALAGNFRVSLAWEPVPSATGYSIKRGTNPNGPFSTVARVPQTSYLDAAVTNGTTYYYSVRSANGVVKGPLSIQVQATPSAPPMTPSGLIATPGHGSIGLAWNAAAGATCYHVKRASSADGPFETIASPDGPAWEDIGLANGTAQYYRVSSENAGGESPDSQPVAASSVAPPAVPTGLQAIPASGEVVLGWTAVAGAVQYRVKRAVSPEGPFAAVASPVEAGYTDAGLSNGTPYHYVVSAVNAHGESLDSFPAQATPVEAPARPSGLTALPGNAKIDLSWSRVPFAVRYRVMRSAAPGGPYVLIASPRDPAYTDCPLTNGMPQHYVVSAVNAGGESLPCAEVASAAVSGTDVSPRSAAEAAPKPAAPPAQDVPTLESIPMPAGRKIQGIDLERLLDLRRVEQLRALFDDTAQKFEEWEVLTLISEEGFETRKTMELLLRQKTQGSAEAFTTGAVALFEKVLKIRAQHGAFVRKLRSYLELLEVPPPSRPALEIALGFILQAARGRLRAEKWVEEPDAHRKGAAEYMKMAYAIAVKYQAAL